MKRVNACTLGVGMLLRSLDSLQSPTGGWDVGSARLMPRLARNQPSFRAVTSPCRTPPLTICTKIYIKISTPAPAHGRPRARRAFAPGVLHVCALLGAGLVVAAAAPRLVPAPFGPLLLPLHLLLLPRRERLEVPTPMDELPDDICQHRRGGSPHPPHHDVVSAVVGVVPLRLPRESVVIELATLLGDRNLPLGLAPARAPSVHLLSGDVPQGLVRGGVVKVLVALAINGLGPPVAVIPACRFPPAPPLLPHHGHRL
mmetsp:Transcript_47433/g.151933  ORF Transcript_47433/g.151933 Transcript_47433/m.151933 type:complete len:257 (+) Transcript_47433:176-946(+)